MERPRRGVTEFLNVFRDAAARFADHESDLLILLDKQGCIERVYQGFTQALGYTAADVLGKPIIDFIDIDSLSIFIKSFGWYNAPRPPFKMLHKGGGLVDVRMEWYEFQGYNGYLILRLV